MDLQEGGAESAHVLESGNEGENHAGSNDDRSDDSETLSPLQGFIPLDQVH